MAYTIAALGRTKKLPPMRKLMIREPSLNRRQSPEQMMAIVKQWTLLLGGEVKGKSS